jgi:hypothetical protein
VRGPDRGHGEDGHHHERAREDQGTRGPAIEPALAPHVHDQGLLARDGEEGESAQDGQEPQRRELGREGRAQEDTRRGQAAQSEALGELFERDHGQEEEQRDGHVVRHDAPVRDDVGAQRGEDGRAEAGRGAEQAPGPRVDGHDQEAGQARDHEPAPEEQPVAVVPPVEEPLAPLPRAAALPGQVVGVGAHVHEQERHRGDHAGQGRVRRVHAQVALGERRVADGQVDDLVERGGLPELAGHGQHAHDQDEAGDRGPGRQAADRLRVLQERSARARRTAVTPSAPR